MSLYLRLRSFLYFGDDDGQPTAFKYSLFRYAHGVPEEGGVVDDLNAPDDPASLAPRRAVELCAMLVKEVVSYERQDGVDGRCTWVLGQAFSMARHLRRCYSKRYERIAEYVNDRVVQSYNLVNCPTATSTRFTRVSMSSPTSGRPHACTTSWPWAACALCASGAPSSLRPLACRTTLRCSGVPAACTSSTKSATRCRSSVWSGAETRAFDSALVTLTAAPGRSTTAGRT